MRPVEPPDEIGGSPIVWKGNGADLKDLVGRTDGVTTITAWELTAVERVALLAGAPLLLSIQTLGYRMQPVGLYVLGCESEADADA